MSNLASLNVKIDRAIKKETDYIVNAMGMTLSTAINIFVRQMVHERAIPFKVHIVDNEVAQTYGNQLLDILKQKDIPNITLPADENGHAYIDKEKHTDLYDWAVNG